MIEKITWQETELENKKRTDIQAIVLQLPLDLVTFVLQMVIIFRLEQQSCINCVFLWHGGGRTIGMHTDWAATESRMLATARNAVV